MSLSECRWRSNPAVAVKYWARAVRPRTLSIAAVPVLVGSALSWSDTGELNGFVLTVTLVAAILIQVGTNLHNDAADFEKGVDDPVTRIGPPRASAQGWLSPRQVRVGANLTFGLALVAGCFLVYVGGWPILAIGLASILAAKAYTGGPWPISFTGFGELFVWIFFGLIAVTGTYYLQSASLTPAALIAGAAVGMPAAAVLVTNNYRDLENDRKAGRRTLAVVFGRTVSRYEYALLLLLPFTLLGVIQHQPALSLWNLGPWVTLPWAVRLVHRFWTQPPGPVFNELLADTARLQLAFGVLLSVSLLGQAALTSGT